MAPKDAREWLKIWEDQGELKRIKAEVDWDEEIGAVSKRVLEKKGPALLFENVKGYKDSYCKQTLTNALGSDARMAQMLGLPKDASVREQVMAYRQIIPQTIKAVKVKDGPVKQNVLVGNKANLLDLPVPKWNCMDGGRYIMTMGGMVTKDPDTGWTNAGLYRGQIMDGKAIAVQAPPEKHCHVHLRKYKERGQVMPVAYVLSLDQTLSFAASCSLAAGVNEYDTMGAILKQPVQLVKCETVDLEVPADAEIVIEGTMSSDISTYRLEGPFGEFTGHYAGDKSPQPVMEITAITYRNNPIFQGTSMGKFIDESRMITSLIAAAHGWNNLEKIGVPGIIDVRCPVVAGGVHAVVKIKKLYQGHAKQVAAVLFASSAGSFKHVMVVEEDIDLYNDDELQWAFAYRLDAKEDGIVIFPGMPGTRLDPSTDPRYKDPNFHGRARWNRVLVDATREWRWEPKEQWAGNRYPPAIETTPEIKSLIEKRWKEYGL